MRFSRLGRNGEGKMYPYYGDAFYAECHGISCGHYHHSVKTARRCGDDRFYGEDYNIRRQTYCDMGRVENDEIVACVKRN